MHRMEFPTCIICRVKFRREPILLEKIFYSFMVGFRKLAIEAFEQNKSRRNTTLNNFSLHGFKSSIKARNHFRIGDKHARSFLNAFLRGATAAPEALSGIVRPHPCRTDERLYRSTGQFILHVEKPADNAGPLTNGIMHLTKLGRIMKR